MNKKLVFATNNNHKLEEVKQLLPHISIVSLQDINCTEEIYETENTLEGNATLKASYIYTKYKYNCFADDTGLEVESLNNEPGVYSARYAGEHCSAEDNVAKLLNNLEGISNRKANFRTVIALYIQHNFYTFEGSCKGEIITKKRGLNGFGYDPIFIPQGSTKTFAEMTMEEKALYSHRAKAIEKLVTFLNKYSW